VADPTRGPAMKASPGIAAGPADAPMPQPATTTDTGAAADAARSTVDEIVEAGKEKAAELKREVHEVTEQAKGQVRQAATQQKDAAARQMDGFAHALMAAADDLRSRGQDFAADYVREAASGLERASGAVRERDLDEIMANVEDFARRQPVAFLGGAVVAGFGIARLVRSSADHRRSRAADHVGATTQRPGGSTGGLA
jgi:polyhydroxyalkanoate synthesis regulator phasin